ncbi:MAG: type II secretion system GspH family protein [Chitinispirillia bacterium]|nr:type II secretion system GspH family protein [Chitinispirillia bacterium]
MRCRRAVYGSSESFSFRDNCSGFTLVEVIAAIAVLGVISAAVVINWSGFMRYQEVRGAAYNMHSELTALKARAIEENQEFVVTYAPAGQNFYTVSRRAVGTDGTGTVVRTVTLPNNVTIANSFDEQPCDPANPPANIDANCSACETWDGQIVIRPNKINTFDAGRVAMRAGNAGRMFCIAKTENEINPRLFFRRNGGAPWTER